ncbi:MAG: Gfo/Idh/MocA family oxidoreductase [Candidatus Sumerlaeota bacterium]|nr:Gfo/Idh/MocA family oxidoreductase [Candidatus Sumerlaeota bacterium]
MKKMSRRNFVKGSAAVGAGAIILGSGASLPPFARAAGANGDIRLAVIGVGSKIKIGGKGKQDIRDFRKVPGVRIAALCDVDRVILDEEAAQCKKLNENVETYTDIRKLLENKDIDAVSITTPNHWHALAAVWACQAGKDVFVQKPASHNIFEGRKMVEAARKYNRIVQCTSVSRSPTGFREAVDYARKGNLGKIQWIYGVNYKPRPSIGKVSGPQTIPATLDYDLWSGPAPVKPLMREFLHYDWHWDWLYGCGDLGNMGIHYMDGCRMAAGDALLPRHVMSIGGRFGYVDDGETPNTLLTFFDYEPAPVIFEVRGLPKDKSLLKESWGGKAMDSYRDVQMGVVIHCENGYVADNKAYDKDGKLIQQFKPTTPNMNVNFIEAVRSRRAGDLVGDILQGHLSAGLVHLGNISYRLGKGAPSGEIAEKIRGRKELSSAFERMQAHLAANGIDLGKTPAALGPMLTMDSDTERFTGEFSEDANKLVTRPYRAPFVVPEKV